MMRKTFDKAFKAQVALGAIKGEKTVQQLSQEYSVHSTQITLWKKQVLDGMADLFDRGDKTKEEAKTAEDTDNLYKQIGQLSVENEFLKKKYRQWYGHEPKQ
jgi:transposase